MNAGRRWWARARRLLLGLALATIAGELGLRAWDAVRGRRTGSLYDEVAFSTGAAGWHRFKMRPGTLTVPERYGDIEYRFNRAGYRDRDHDASSRRRTIVLLGDSVTFGLGVEQEEIYAHRLQEELSRRFPGAYEVANLAMWSYHTRDELAALEEDGLALAPGLVVLQFYMNDFALPPADWKPAPLPLAARLRGLRNQLLYSSNLYRRLHQLAYGAAYALVHDLRRQRFPERLNRLEPESKRRYLEAFADDDEVPALMALRAIAGRSAGHGARFALLLSPDEVQLYDAQYDVINRRMETFAAAHGLPFIDLLPVLRAAPDRHRLFLDGVHLSSYGHELVAAHLASELAARGLLPPSPAAQGGS